MRSAKARNLQTTAGALVLLALATQCGFSNNSVMAASAGGKKQLSPAPTPAPLPQANKIKQAIRPIKDKWAVVIGIDTFKDPTIPHLKYSAKDAADFAKFLVEHGNFARDHVLLLTNEKATRDNIKEAIGGSWLPRRAQADDLVLIFASTHGSPKELDVAGENFLVAYDSEATKLYVTGIRFADLAPEIKSRTGCDRVVLLLDACNSGAANVGGKGLLLTRNFDIASLAGEGQVVISSSASDQRSFESMRYDNGVFTKQLIAALEAKGNKTTLSEAFNYLKERVETEVRYDRMTTQTPVMRSKWSGGELILIAVPTQPRKVEEDTNLEIPDISGDTQGTPYQKALKLYEEKRYTEVLTLVEPAAQAGDPECQTLLGSLNLSGHGVPRNFENAFQWFQKSASMGCASGQRELATMYYFGFGMPKILNKAFEIYTKAAEQNEPVAMLALAPMYLLGVCVAKDEEKSNELLKKAAELFKSAAERGSLTAQVHLAVCYRYGLGCQKNLAKAIELDQKAADRGNAGAQFELGTIYEQGDGVDQDMMQAVHWYQKAAEDNFISAMVKLGLIFKDGKGVLQNYKTAFEWFQKAADLGDPLAQNYLGVMYDNGEGVPQNYFKAAELYQRAAEAGNALAQCNLGSSYMEGTGVPKNLKKAEEWLQKSADQGFEVAKNTLKDLKQLK